MIDNNDREVKRREARKRWSDKNPNYSREWALKNKEKTRKYLQDYRAKNLERIREISRLSAQAWRKKYPDKSKQGALEYYYKNVEKIRLRRRVGAQELKKNLLTHYGNAEYACVTCGESRSACLSLDHINNNGYLGRKENGLSGTRLYQYLKANNYPKGFQTLCMNCQFIKREECREKPLKQLPSLIELANGNCKIPNIY